MRWGCTLVVIAACSFNPPPVGGGSNGIDASLTDAPLADVSAELGCNSFSVQFDTCMTAFGGPVVLTSGSNNIYKYNTDTNNLQQCDDEASNCQTPTNPTHQTINGIDMLLVNSFTLGSSNTLRVSGSLPFGIASTGSVVIDGKLELIGGGGNRSATACATSAGNSSGGAGGGGGAGFQRAGNDGGNGGGATGSRGIASTLVGDQVIGGCPGGTGGSGGGSGGKGGGAVYIAAAASIGVAGSINAGGVRGSSGGTRDPRWRRRRIGWNDLAPVTRESDHRCARRKRRRRRRGRRGRQQWQRRQ